MDNMIRSELNRLDRLIYKQSEAIKWLVVSDVTLLVLLVFVLFGNAVSWMHL